MPPSMREEIKALLNFLETGAARKPDKKRTARMRSMRVKNQTDREES